MKWFKHFSDSLNDPKIFELMRKHGPSGYLAFFGILEIYAKEFKTDHGWMLHTSTAHLKHILHTYHTNRLSILLQSLHDLCGWYVDLSGENVKIFIPNFRKLLDETTLKKMRAKEGKFRNYSGNLPKKGLTEEEEDKDEDKDNSNDTGKTGIDLELKELSKQIYDARIWGKVHAWVATAIKGKQNREAIAHTLRRVLQKRKLENGDADWWAYCTRIIQVEGGNYNEREFVAKAQEQKKALEGFMDTFGNGS